jgi:lipopolysaccharide/colanic/teichoic acid biosynthesis glycosyltransferase
VFVVPRLHHLHLAPAPVDRIGSVAVVRVAGPNLVGPARTARRVVDAAIALLALALLAPLVGLRAVASGRRALPHNVADLWKVVRGDIGLVGPHPEPPEDALCSPYECYRLRNRARPGLTGLARVNGLHGRPSAHERARYDNSYVETWSPWLDVKIAAVAIAQLVAGREP